MKVENVIVVEVPSLPFRAWKKHALPVVGLIDVQ
jgi:hypothetical protein